MHKNIGYHTRLYSDHAVKVCGGTFGGDIDHETVNRLVNTFSVIVKPSGTPVLVDKQGREVRLYLSVDVSKTDKGIEALKAWRIQREAERQRQEELEEKQAQEIEEAMEGLSHEEILAKLKS